MCIRDRVLYIAAEGAFGIGHRLDAWESAWGPTIRDESFVVLAGGVNLLEKDKVAELVGVVKDDGFTFVVIDTLNRCATGGDENSARDMGVVVDALYQVRDATGDGSVELLHHTCKDGTTTRGSSALMDGVDTVYKSEGDARRLKVACTKRKDGPDDDRLDLKIVRVDGTDSCCVESARLDGQLDGRASRDIVLSKFSSNFGSTGATRAELKTVCDLPPSTFAYAVNLLVSDGVLVNEGTKLRAFYVQRH